MRIRLFTNLPRSLAAALATAGLLGATMTANSQDDAVPPAPNAQQSDDSRTNNARQSQQRNEASASDVRVDQRGQSSQQWNQPQQGLHHQGQVDGTHSQVYGQSAHHANYGWNDQGHWNQSRGSYGQQHNPCVVVYNPCGSSGGHHMAQSQMQHGQAQYGQTQYGVHSGYQQYGQNHQGYQQQYTTQHGQHVQPIHQNWQQQGSNHAVVDSAHDRYPQDGYVEDTRPNRAVLGIRIRNVDNGVRITKVQPNSPAQRIGLRVGDHVTRFNGQQISKTDDLLNELEDINMDDEVDLTIDRDDQEKQMSTQLTTYKQAFSSRGQDDAISRNPNRRGNQERREALKPNLDVDSRGQNKAADDLENDSIDNEADQNDTAADAPQLDADDSDVVPSDNQSAREANKRQKRQRQRNQADDSDLTVPANSDAQDADAGKNDASAVEADESSNRSNAPANDVQGSQAANDDAEDVEIENDVENVDDVENANDAAEDTSNE